MLAGLGSWQLVVRLLSLSGMVPCGLSLGGVWLAATLVSSSAQGGNGKTSVKEREDDLYRKKHERFRQ